MAGFLLDFRGRTGLPALFLRRPDLLLFGWGSEGAIIRDLFQGNNLWKKKEIPVRTQ
jgi:hypothetical protein